MGAPTIVRGLTTSGDWTLGGGLSNYLSGNNAIGQQIRSRLLEFTGNCFWNPQGGLSWPQLLGQRNNQQLLQLQIGSIITNTNGVLSIQQLSINLNRNTRQLSVTWLVTTVFSVYSASFQANIPQVVGG